MSIIKKTEIGGTTGDYALDVYVKGGSANPFILKGKVTTATSSTVFASTELIGYGNDAFKDWEIWVFYDTAGTDAAPQGEKQPISDYVSSTGTFTHTAFTADLSVDDVVLILHPYEATGGDATEAKQDTIITDIGVVDGLIDVPAKDATTDAYMREVVGKKDDTAQTTVGTTRSIIAYIKGLLNQVATIIAKTDLLNSASGTSTLNDANPSDTIVPGSLPTKMHVIFDISTIIVAADDFTIEVKVGASGSERVVAYYKITSDGTYTTIDTGSGTGSKVKARRIDISDIMVYTGEQVMLNYTKSSATDRDVLYRYVCGV